MCSSYIDEFMHIWFNYINIDLDPHNNTIWIDWKFLWVVVFVHVTRGRHFGGPPQFLLQIQNFFSFFFIICGDYKKKLDKKRRGGDLSNWKKRGGKNIRKDVNGRRWDIKKMMAPSYNTHKTYRPATHKWKFARPFFDIIRFVCCIKIDVILFFPVEIKMRHKFE
jgi:hypothetical protein